MRFRETCQHLPYRKFYSEQLYPLDIFFKNASLTSYLQKKQISGIGGGRGILICCSWGHIWYISTNSRLSSIFFLKKFFIASAISCCNPSRDAELQNCEFWVENDTIELCSILNKSLLNGLSVTVLRVQYETKFVSYWEGMQHKW